MRNKMEEEKEIKKTEFKWIGLTTIKIRISTIFAYEIYNRNQFMVRMIMNLSIEFILFLLY